MEICLLFTQFDIYLERDDIDTSMEKFMVDVRFFQSFSSQCFPLGSPKILKFLKNCRVY